MNLSVSWTSVIAVYSSFNVMTVHSGTAGGNELAAKSGTRRSCTRWMFLCWQIKKKSVKCPQSTLFQLISETGRRSIHGPDVHDSPALMMEEIITAAGWLQRNTNTCLVFMHRIYYMDSNIRLYHFYLLAENFCTITTEMATLYVTRPTVHTSQPLLRSH